jgi:hypothetical protein
MLKALNSFVVPLTITPVSFLDKIENGIHGMEDEGKHLRRKIIVAVA